jgi:hypothetical protein
MSCPGAHLCVAINGSDQILTSRDPAAPSARWKVVRLPGHPKLSLVSCPDQHFCVTLDTSNRVAIAKNPTGNSRSWKITSLHLPARFHVQLDDLSCPTRRLCVATDYGGRVLSSQAPSGGAKTWRGLSSNRGVPGGRAGRPLNLALEGLRGRTGPGAKGTDPQVTESPVRTFS